MFDIMLRKILYREIYGNYQIFLKRRIQGFPAGLKILLDEGEEHTNVMCSVGHVTCFLDLRNYVKKEEVNSCDMKLCDQCSLTKESHANIKVDRNEGIYK